MIWNKKIESFTLIEFISAFIIGSIVFLLGTTGVNLLQWKLENWKLKMDYVMDQSNACAFSAIHAFKARHIILDSNKLEIFVKEHFVNSKYVLQNGFYFRENQDNDTLFKAGLAFINDIGLPTILLEKGEMCNECESSFILPYRKDLYSKKIWESK